MKRLLVALAFGALALPPLYGADIYRWVDDNGRVHLSEQVPKEFKDSAIPLPRGKDCASLRRRFQESADCYGPFFNANGSFKPEALEVCGPPVPAPGLECSSTPAY
jgi:hypothetical protein